MSASANEDVVIVSATRTPVGSFNGVFGNVPAHVLGTGVLQAAMQRAKLEPGEVDEVILGQILTAAQGPEPGAPGGDRGRHPGQQDGVRHQPGVRLRPARGGPRGAAGAHRREQHRDRRRTGEHEPISARGLSARRAEDGRYANDRHHDEGRPARRLPGLRHGRHGGERGQGIPDHPRAAGHFRQQLAAQGVRRAEGRPLQGGDHSRHGENPQGRDGGERRRIHPPRQHARDDGQAAPPPLPRTARSPPAMPAASTTAPPPWW